MIRIGFNLWFRDLPKLRERLVKAVEIGLEHAELSIDYPFGIVELEPFYTMAKSVREFGLSISVHAPWQEIHLASPLSEVREASLKIIQRVVDEAYRIEAQYLVLHVTSEQSICKAKRRPLENPCVKAAINSLSELAKYAEDRGLYIAVENAGDVCCGRIDLYSYIVSEAPILACIDIAHAIASDRQLLKRVQEVDYADVLREWVSAIGLEKLYALHLHGIRVDSSGRVEEHVDLSQNRVDVKRIVQLTSRYLKFIVFEIFRSASGREFDIVELAQLVKEFKSWAIAYA
ncbi:MAG TPA: hypothetical protein EYH02_05335 [Ignisphaera aggregans]|uniref:Xylose isomerase-like TIM barrel domain-containing protein n=1 Tax=Ignisphaera aggregans TaxID=334771 RepID=A0A832Z068_9CREN|nr:hypothetical protein [Ignisphaera aggregans]